MTKRSDSIAVFEHGALKLGHSYQGVEFKRHHLLSLEKYHGEKGTPFFSLIRDGVKFCNYVGVLQVGKLTIEILPKADQSDDTLLWRKKLIEMLQKVGVFTISATSQANLKLKPNHLLDLYFIEYLKEVESLLHTGLVKKYRTTENNLTALKGSLQFYGHLKRNLVHQERFYTRHTVYDRENPLNKVLFKALRLVRGLNVNPTLSSKIGALLLDFPEMPDIPVSEVWFQKFTYNRKTEHYRKAIEIARLLLLNYHPDLSRGRDHVLALMFDMNLLWEKFVYVSLRKHLKDSEVRAQQSKPYWKLYGHRSVRMRPDIIISKGEKNFVIDTKWKLLIKLRPSDDDLKQMYAYSKYWKTDHTILCYPGSGNSLNGHFFDEFSEEMGKKCTVVTIAMEASYPINEWQERIKVKIEELL